MGRGPGDRDRRADRAGRFRYPDYYLYADVFGEGGYGTPYIDCDCSLEGPLTIVYGHHMDDGSVFADFARFSDRDYAVDHREVIVYVREGDRRVELETVAVDVVNANRETLRTEFEERADFDSYVREAVEESDLVLEPPQDLTTFTRSPRARTRRATRAPSCTQSRKGVAYEDRDVRPRCAHGDMRGHRMVLHARQRRVGGRRGIRLAAIRPSLRECAPAGAHSLLQSI